GGFVQNSLGFGVPRAKQFPSAIADGVAGLCPARFPAIPRVGLGKSNTRGDGVGSCRHPSFQTREMIAPIHLGSVLPCRLVKTCVEIVQYPHSSRKFGLARTSGVRQAVQLFELFLLKQCCNSVFLLVKGL